MSTISNKEVDMGTISVTSFDGGDKRTSASASFLIESGGFEIHGVALEGDHGVEISHIKRGNKIFVPKGEGNWAKSEFKGKKFTVLKKRGGELQDPLLDKIGFYDTPICEPINCRYEPRAYGRWERDVDGFTEDIPEIKPEDIGGLTAKDFK